MKFQVKITLLLLATSLTPLLIGIFTSYTQTESQIYSDVTSRLQRVAVIQKSRVKNTIERYLENTNLIISRTTLRNNLAKYSSSTSSQNQKEITQIILDAKNSTPLILKISIVGLDGVVVSSTKESEVGKESTGRWFDIAKQTSIVDEVFTDEAGILAVRGAGPMFLNDNLIGVVEINFKTDPLSEIVEDYTGLGTTGESFVVTADTQRNAIYLTPLRFDKEATLTKTQIGEPVNIPLLAAISGRESLFTGDGIIDYRGKSIFAATSYIDQLKWGIVAKIDKDEALQSVSNLKNVSALIVIITSAVVLAICFIISRYISHPILKLADSARQIARGNYSIRSDIKSSDEIGQLSGSFNQMAASVQKREEEAKVVERAKDEFFTIGSHELRTPLTVILGNVSMMKQDLLEKFKDTQLTEMLTAIERAGARLNSIVDDLLEVSSFQMGKISFKKEKFDMMAALKEVVEVLSKEAQAKGLSTTVKDPESNLAEALGDVLKVKQVLTNLIQNGIKFTDKGGVTLELSQTDGFLNVKVIDTGRGIPSENQKLLFGRLQQAGDDLLSRESEGTGLGLYISKFLVEGMGGKIWLAKSEVGKGGSTFIFTIPSA